MELLKKIPNMDISGIKLYVCKCKNKLCNNTFKSSNKKDNRYCSLICGLTVGDSIYNNRSQQSRIKPEYINQVDDTQEDDE